MKSRALVCLVAGLIMLSGPFSLAGDRSVVKRTTAVYPELAKRMHLAGTIKLEVKVDPAGKVTDIKVLSGHPLLGAAAKDAVKSWVFAGADAATTEVVEVEFKI
jgi:TonB family protein